MAIFYREWGRNLAPRDGQKRPCHDTCISYLQPNVCSVCYDISDLKS